MQNKRLRAFLKNLDTAPAKSLEAEVDQKESDQPQHWAHKLPASSLNEELLQLLSLFLADRQLLDSFEKDMTVLSSRDDPIFMLVEYYWEPLVATLLIETAVKNRWLMDAWLDTAPTFADGSKDRSGPWDVAVGQLSVDGGEWQRLSFREACNKIIHAERIEPEFDETKPSSPPVLTGIIVEATGHKDGKPWRAKINICNYVRASVFNNYGGIDFPRGWMQQR